MNLMRQLCLAFILSIGFSAFCGLIGNWAGEQVRHAVRRNEPYRHLVIKADGTTRVMEDRQYLEPGERPAAPDPDQAWMDIANLPARQNARLPGILDDWHWRLREFTDSRHPGTVWYFVTDAQPHGNAYFAGYDVGSKECIGYLGTAGFRSERLPTEERFPFCGSERGTITRLHLLNATPWGQFAPIGFVPPGNVQMPWHVFVQGDNDTIYLVDLDQRTVNVAFTGRHILSSAILLRSHPSADAGRRDLVVRSEDSIVVINGRTTGQHQFAIPAEIRDTDFSWGETTHGTQLAVWNGVFSSEKQALAQHVLVMDAAGGVLDRRDLDVPVMSSPSEDRWMLGLSVPSPLYVDFYVGFLRPYLMNGERESYGAALMRTVGEYWPSLLFVHILSALLAGLCYRRQVLNGAVGAESIIWPLFVFLLGLPGWIGYRCTVPSRPAEFLTPELRGTEVFV
jgi:hypothetical protein